ncbi:unnamed protein product [Sphenostylis stenocarpa]|uniref:CRIB domain-containing protein n=1 Tax=Sphenostylis stenocarpa TaxID=92480 RepID=A0AA86V321_9FABA|nr:unnamed protein product [Sphenostylis stenocarpa]
MSNNNNNNKVKGLLKGLRFISQIFDNEGKDSVIEIGHPTDVKHVAHIGYDGQGPSDNNPSWMNEFKSVPGNSSAPKDHKGGIHSKESDSSIQRASEDSMERSSRSVNRHSDDSHLLDSAKSKRQSNSTGNMRESRAKEKSDRPRNPKRSSKPSQPNDHHSCHESKHTDQHMQTNDYPLHHQDSDLPPKKSRSKISKDGSAVSSSKSRSKAYSRDHNHEGHAKRNSKSTDKHESFEEEEGHYKRGSSENILKSYVN